MATNRTLQFLGYAIGTSPVQITASINDTVVFSGAVETSDPNLQDSLDENPYPVLFSVDNSDLFPTTFSGSYPMTMTVTGGSGVVVGPVLSNYMSNFVFDEQCQLTNASINGSALTFDSVTGNVSAKQSLRGQGIAPSTHIIDGSGTAWTVNKNQTVGPVAVSGGKWSETAGNATDFLPCYNGTPTNSEGTRDPRSSVTIDGVAQVSSVMSTTHGAWSWEVPTGSTLVYNLNVSIGNTAS